jgi:hypothetical protein
LYLHFETRLANIPSESGVRENKISIKISAIFSTFALTVLATLPTRTASQGESFAFIGVTIAIETLDIYI